MASQSGIIRKAIVDAIVAVPCRPKNANYPNMPPKKVTRNFPYMDVSFLSETNRQLFAGTSTEVEILMQVDFYMAEGKNLELFDGYLDSFRTAFRHQRRVGRATVESPPAVGFRGAVDGAFRMSLTFTLKYINRQSSH